MPGENNGESHCNENNDKVNNILLVIISIKLSCGANVIALRVFQAGGVSPGRARRAGHEGEKREENLASRVYYPSHLPPLD